MVAVQEVEGAAHPHRNPLAGGIVLRGCCASADVLLVDVLMMTVVTPGPTAIRSYHRVIGSLT